MHIERDRSQLLVIDVQAKLAPHVAGQAQVVANATRLLRYARRLEVPATITEHYPRGLGPTVAEVREAAGNDAPVLEKIAFSSWKDAGIRARLEGLRAEGRDQVVVAGMEAHVCVAQTALDLVAATGLDVFLVADAVGSRETRRAISPSSGCGQAGATSSRRRWSRSSGWSAATIRPSRTWSRLVK